MSDFRESQNSAHPNKTNVLMSAIIIMLILIVTLQICMMYGTLNNALSGNNKFAWATFAGSAVLFIAGAFLLKYLPDSKKKREESLNDENDKNDKEE